MSGRADSRAGAQRQVLGPVVDDQTRCVHYASPLDVVAIEFFCCRRLYPCLSCHEQVEDHPIRAWPRERFAEHALLCGVCRARISITDYLSASGCPACRAPFNPGCASHHHLYFES